MKYTQISKLAPPSGQWWNRASTPMVDSRHPVTNPFRLHSAK